MTDGVTPDQTPALPGRLEWVLPGPIEDSERQGYMRVSTTSEGRQRNYDLPVEWILALGLGGDGARDPGARPAFSDDDPGTALDFETFLLRQDVREMGAPRGLDPPGGGQT